MTREDVAKLMEATFIQLQFLREAGQKEYAHTEDNAFANFERVGNYLKTDRKKILAVYMLKHLDGIIAAVNGHKSQREPVEGRIHDAMVYLILLKGMFQEDEKRELTNPTPNATLAEIQAKIIDESFASRR